MADDAVGDERLAVLVEVHAPGVGRAVGDDLVLLLRRMVTPDAAVDGRALVFRRSRRSDARFGDDTVPAVDPAVRSPQKAIDDVMPRFQAPTFEDDPRLA